MRDEEAESSEEREAALCAYDGCEEKHWAEDPDGFCIYHSPRTARMNPQLEVYGRRPGKRH